MEEQNLKPEEQENIDQDASPDNVPDAESDWQTRRKEAEKQKEDRRQHFQSVAERSEQAKQYFRPAKPAPALDDGSHKKVAAYTRVSTASIEQVSSIENQTLYYTKKIEGTPNWELQAIYSDEGKSGTSMRHRDQFRQMLRDAKLKKMDLIICASVSRFARNVTDCLEQVSELKTMNPSHPVGVYFETENIYTLNPDSDQAFAVHALLADWESANKSRRMILSYDQRILTGQYPVSDLLGYRHTREGDLVIVPEEAKTVRFIFLAFLVGYTYDDIAEVLTDKQRTTLRGRQDWNGQMVANIMLNERRWGNLEARKTIVIDYKKGKSARNHNDRCSAYVPDHHEAIVSPEIAKAAEMMRRSSGHQQNGYAALAVINTGMLKGFVSVVPSWGGVDNDTFHLISRSVYSQEELDELHHHMQLMNGNVHTNVLQMDLCGYEVPYGVGYLTKSMPSLTVYRKKLVFNSACHKRLNGCSHIEILYHPVMQAIVIRESSKEKDTSVQWLRDDGTEIVNMPSGAFSDAVYQNMCWKKEYAYRFRGITKERNGAKIMIFLLDEPQIMISKEQRQALIDAGYDMSKQTAYIPYKVEPDDQDEGVALGAAFGYPEEWNHCIGMSYEMRAKREASISAITDGDIMACSTVVENPMIGHVPTRQEIEDELEQLLMSM